MLVVPGQISVVHFLCAEGTTISRNIYGEFFITDRPVVLW